METCSPKCNSTCRIYLYSQADYKNKGDNLIRVLLRIINYYKSKNINRTLRIKEVYYGIEIKFDRFSLNIYL